MPSDSERNFTVLGTPAAPCRGSELSSATGVTADLPERRHELGLSQVPRPPNLRCICATVRLPAEIPPGRKAGVTVVLMPLTAVAAVVMPAAAHENRASGLMLERLTQQGVTDRLEPALVDPWVTAVTARTLGGDTSTSRCVGSGGMTSSRSFAPSGTPGESRSPTVGPPGEVVREHQAIGDRLAVVGLHRHNAASSVPGTSAPAPSRARA